MRHGQGRQLVRAFALTLASALLWGVAHLATGRRFTGGVLATAYTVVFMGIGLCATRWRGHVAELAVQPDWLTLMMIGCLVLAVCWTLVIAVSWRLVRPEGLGAPSRILAVGAVTGLCLVIAAPFAFAAHNTLVARDTLTAIFGGHADKGDGRVLAGKKRLNVLLLGGDSGRNRFGVRTDSVTLASVDTRTGDTVLLGLPRNLEHVPMPQGPARQRFPDGFAGDGALTPGLLNEVYQYAEEHPEMVPGVPDGKRGPALIKQTVAGVLGLPVDYYVLADMKGFAQLVDAMGGVWLRIPEDITFGKYDEGRLAAGYRRLSGTEALWYGRSRTFSSDYVRMARQKCLLRAIARQADPGRVLTRFEQLAVAARHTIATDVPQKMLPSLLKLAGRVKDGGKITSLQFTPPLIDTSAPDWALIQRLSAQALASPSRKAADALHGTAEGSAAARKANVDDASSGGAAPSPADGAATSLDATCPS
ncbi:LytR family transcriptional attenuator [Actinocorallia herbida]|uniref:LytR family transcriptional attenuator n=1 Tax=Actinocorallia herbida TaxID=58109 RepID=A0A3N1D4X9_9ACTN|nr:LCP family protein [Actinocorallia herbida]ROO88577.1 LytR family transcriptional attenuator [Actinocorallia herbida]